MSRARFCIGILLAICACALSPANVRAYPTPAVATVGVILPLTGPAQVGGIRMRDLLQVVANDINAGNGTIGGVGPNYLGGCFLNLSFIDSVSDPVTAMRAVHTLRATEPNLVGIIGDLYDNTTLGISLLTSRLGILTITPGGASTSLVNNIAHPMLLRTVMNDYTFATSVTDLMSMASWYRIAFFSTDDDSGRGFMDVFLRTTNNSALVDSFDITSIVVPASQSDLTSSVIAEALDTLYADATYRIFFVHAQDIAETIMRMAYARGMIGEGPDGITRQWIGTFCTAGLVLRMQDLPEALYGSVCATDPMPLTNGDTTNNAAEVALQTAMYEYNPIYFSAGSYLNYHDIATANALLAFAAVLKSAFADTSRGNTGADLRAIFDEGLSFQQVNGDSMSFSADGGVSLSSVLLNYDMSLKRYRLITDYSTIVLASGSTAFPKDRPRVYITGDVLPATFDGKIIVLTYVMSVLGAWTALILLEQALSFWSRAMWQQAVGWIALAAVGFGGCGIFPTFYMSYTALTLDSDAVLWFKIGSIVGGAVMPAGVTFIAFLIAMLSVPGGLKPAANVNVNEVSDISTTSATSQQSGSGTSTSASRSHFRVLRGRFSRQVNKFQEFIVETARSSTWRLPLAAAVLAVLSVAEHTLVIDGFFVKASLVTDPGSVVGGVIIAFIINIISLTMYFHMTRSGLRYFAPFLLSGSILADFLLPVVAGTWKYVSTTDMDNTSGKTEANDTLAILIAAICAATCLGMMAFNVNRLRVSRNQLDKVLAQVAGQVRALETEIDYEKEATGALGEQAAFFRRTLEVINLCRPVWRPYAIALALAEPDEEALERQVNGDKLLLPSGAPAGHAIGTAAASAAVEKAKAKEAQKVKRSVLGLPESSGSSSSVEDPLHKESSKSKEALVKPLITGVAAPTPKSEPSGGESGEGGDTTTLPGTTMQHSPGNKMRSIISGAGVRTSHDAPSDTMVVAATGSHVDAKSTGSDSNSSTDAPTRSSHSTATATDWQRVHAPKQSKQLALLLKDLAEMGNLQGPLPQRVSQDIKLPQILSHPATLELMKDVLAKNLSPENIALWIDVQRYRSLESAQVRKAVADEIFQTFIVSGAKFEVNLSSFMKDYVQSQLYKGNIGLDLFDEVEREIYRLMVTNNVDSLVTGPMFKLSALLLQHPQYQLKSMPLVNNVRGEIGGNVPPTIGLNAQQSLGGGGYIANSPAAGGYSQGRSAAPAPGPPRASAGATASRASSTVAPSTPTVRGATGVASTGAPPVPRTNNFTGNGTADAKRAAAIELAPTGK